MDKEALNKMTARQSQIVYVCLVGVLVAGCVAAYFASVYCCTRWKMQKGISQTYRYQGSMAFIIAKELTDYLNAFYSQKAAVDVRDVNQAFTDYITAVTQNKNEKGWRQGFYSTSDTLSETPMKGIYIQLPPRLDYAQSSFSELVAFTESYVYDKNVLIANQEIPCRGLVFYRDGQFVPMVFQEEIAMDFIGGRTGSSRKPDFYEGTVLYPYD